MAPGRPRRRPRRRTSPPISGAPWPPRSCKIIGASEAEDRISRVLESLGRVERVHGFFLDRIDPASGAPLRYILRTDKPIRPLVSAVDNGWLAAALIMVRNTRPGAPGAGRGTAEADGLRLLLRALRSGRPGQASRASCTASTGRDDKTFGTLHGLVNTEPRIASYIGIARGQLPPEHYYRIDRTLAAGTGAAGPEAAAAGRVPDATWASRSSRGTTRTEGCRSSRAGAAACSRR